MNTEALGNSWIGRLFIRFIAMIMESRLRYRFWGPRKILEGAGIQSGMKVLEVGCGTGYFTLPASELIGTQGELISIDVSPLSVEMVSKKIEQSKIANTKVIKRSVLDTKMEANYFDEIIIFGVLPAPMLPLEELLKEMHRILKPSGRMAIWPSTWVNNTINSSKEFSYISKKNGVTNYQKN
jgi:demethylmenaquinone methyltransferase/2-methoxy-6-polyprenyl-1,4-benzoquinol methylase